MKRVPEPQVMDEKYSVASYARVLDSPLAINYSITLNMLKSIRPTGTCVDLGCGPGHFTKYLSQIGLDVTGYDLSEPMLENAKRVRDHSLQNTTFINDDIINAKTANISIMNNVLHHISASEVISLLRRDDDIIFVSDLVRLDTSKHTNIYI